MEPHHPHLEQQGPWIEPLQVWAPEHCPSGVVLRAVGVASDDGDAAEDCAADVAETGTVTKMPPVCVADTGEEETTADETGVVADETAAEVSLAELVEEDELDPPPTPFTAAHVPVNPDPEPDVVFLIVISASGPGSG